MKLIKVKGRRNIPADTERAGPPEPIATDTERDGPPEPIAPDTEIASPPEPKEESKELSATETAAMPSQETEDVKEDAQNSVGSEDTEKSLYSEDVRDEDAESSGLRPTDLSELLKEGTQESHQRAENTQFVKDFLKGSIKRELFKLATVALYYTYSALEEEMDRHKGHADFAPLYFPLELHRKKALEKDLAFFYGDSWPSKIQCSAATKKYVDRIRHVGKHEPELLVAHAYTRYMGDLSGGQILRKVAQRALHLPSTGEGVQFYIFENVTNAQKFKQLYRARMNALDLNDRTKARIVKEANKAFHFNMKVFDELDKIGATITEEAQDGGLPVHDGKGNISKCPYYAAIQGRSNTICCPFRAGLALLRLPSVQLVLAVLVVFVAGFAAWYMK